MSGFVEITPQVLVRGDGQHQSSPRRERFPQCGQSLQFLWNVFQDVEHADQVEGLSKWAMADIALHQRTGGSLLREAQAVKPEFQADHSAVGTGLA